MTRPDAAGGRILGRSLLTLANVITVAAPVAADWNDSHIFNERWPGHARLHGVTALALATSLSAVNIWSIWSGGSNPASARLYAAAYWAPFFLAPLVPGTAVDDPPHPVQRVAGVPASLLGAAATIATAAAGWLIDRRSAVPVDDRLRAADAPGGHGLSRPILAARRTNPTSQIPTLGGSRIRPLILTWAFVRPARIR